MIDHSSCDHERTPKARAACRRKGGPRGEMIDGHYVEGPRLQEVKRRSERPSVSRKASRANDDTHTPHWRPQHVLKALSEAPARVRDFIERCEDRGFKINPMPVEVGYSIEVYSSRGAGRVTWEGEKVAWFTRLGYTSITTRVTNYREVWKVLTGTDDE